ncbi:hypothetical protein [Methylomonas koyamae]|nr:hypothetical protein [Methylomonas koyamae]
MYKLHELQRDFAGFVFGDSGKFRTALSPTASHQNGVWPFTATTRKSA